METSMSFAPNTRRRAALLLLPLLAACATADSAPGFAGAPPVPVTWQPVTVDSVAQPVTGTGTYGSRDDVSLAFKIGGVVARVLVDEGDAVRQGAVLATLDLREIDALRTKARVAVEKAERDVTRLRVLYADSVATRAQLQDAESALAAAEADLATATVNRDYAVITAPGAGRVLRRTVTAGALVAPGQEVLRLANDARGRVVRLGLTDRDVVRVREGQRATITFDALPGESFTGRVILRGVASDPRTGTVPVEIAVTGVDALPAGTVARVQIEVPARVPVALVPIDALLEADGDSATVYLLRDDTTAARRRVRTRFLAGDRVAVDGLDAGARVVTRGAAYLADGAAVRIVEGVR
jgi:multidrug efflux system membrane fusion protein